MESVIVLFGKPGAGKGTRLDEFLDEEENQFDTVAVSGLMKKEIADVTPTQKTADIFCCLFLL